MQKYLLLFLFGIFFTYQSVASIDKKQHFSVSSDLFSSISLDVEYGNVMFYVTSHDSVIVDVRIEMNNISESKATKELKGFNVIHRVRDGVLSMNQTRGAVTNTVRKFRFNYRIGVPKYYPLQIKSLFSDVSISNWDQSLSVDGNYSNFYFQGTVGKELKGKIKMKYCNMNADTLLASNVTISGGSLSAGCIKGGNVYSSYSKVNFKYAERVALQGSYDQWNILKAHGVKMTGKSSQIKLGYISGEMNIVNSLAPVYIDDISLTNTNVNIKLSKADLFLDANMNTLNNVYFSLIHGVLDCNSSTPKFTESVVENKTIYEYRDNSIEGNGQVRVDMTYGTIYVNH